MTGITYSRWLSVCSGTCWGLVAALCASPHAQAQPSYSYEFGYNDMLSGMREIVADAATQGIHESMAQVVGSSQQAATICEGNLQARIAGGVSGRHGTTPIPTDFSSRDYLDGCRTAGQQILASGQ